MARGRMISKSLSTSEKFAALVDRAGPLAEFCQTLYTLLVPHTDDFGRLQGDAFTVKHVVHPSSSRTLQEFHAALQLLDDVELIQRYAVKKKLYVQVEHFDDHQQGLHKRTRSQFPAPPRGNGSGTLPDFPGNSGLREEKRREEKRSTPLPPLQGGRARKRRRDIPVSGRTCQHEPRCSSFTACRDKTI